MKVGVIRMVTAVQGIFFTNLHRRSIKFRFGEYDGKNNNPIPNAPAKFRTHWQCRRRALSITGVIGVFNPNAAICRNKSQTVSAVMYCRLKLISFVS